MSEKIVQLNEEVIKDQIKELVRGSVEETLNELLEKEAESLTQAARYERSEARQGYRSGHYDRSLTTTSGDITLHIPCHSFIRTGSPAIRMRWMPFETALRAVRMIFCGKESKKNIEIPRSPYTLTPVRKPWLAERSLSGWPAGIGR